MTNKVVRKPLMGIVVPCYNEEEVLQITINSLEELLRQLIEKSKVSDKSFIAFIDDGSKDKTWQIIEEASKEQASVRGLKLAHNVGHQSALVAGLENFTANADFLISIDADLQDDIQAIETMVDAFMDGFEIVYGVRKERNTDSFFKKWTALFFYRLLKIMGVEIVYNHSDFRLVSKRVLENFKSFGEVNLFLRGIFPLMGFRNTCVYYDRLERKAGKSKYPLRKMLSFAFDGVTSFSIKPLRFVSITGIVVFIVSLGMASYSLYSYLFLGTVPGWTSITLPIYFISGIQILCIGIIGEYLGKIYKEVKHRPRYIIERVINTEIDGLR